MIKVMFVCLGNICRSPMAEFVFKDIVKKQGLEKEFYIKVPVGAIKILKININFTVKDKSSRSVTKKYWDIYTVYKGNQTTYRNGHIFLIPKDAQHVIIKSVQVKQNVIKTVVNVIRTNVIL